MKVTVVTKADLHEIKSDVLKQSGKSWTVSL